ncbi:MAG TPA: ATP-dependent Clp protease adaptor ClpS [Spirochaetia bacterium]|nr:ATP-dependent Clp protease adaptor ClpS [Spirochaetia bacterium]
MGDAVRPPDSGTDLKTKPRQDVKEPEMYKVVLINDDYTPKEFVVEILISIFGKSRADAWRTMQAAHTAGRSVVGVYTYDIAYTKASQSRQKAKDEGYPMQMTVEGA